MSKKIDTFNALNYISTLVDALKHNNESDRLPKIEDLSIKELMHSSIEHIYNIGYRRGQQALVNKIINIFDEYTTDE